MKPVGSLLSHTLKKFGLEEKLKLLSVQKAWHEIFSAPLSLHTYPAELKNGELLVNVDSPVWLQQLKFFKQDMIKKLHGYDIREIVFRRGRVYSKGAGEQRAQGLKNAEPSKPRTLEPSETEWIGQIISDIHDPELKESMRKAIEKALARNA